MFAIGEFSKITGLTIRTLRFYHDKGILVPAWVDGQTGYRYYEPRQADKARLITQLRRLEFSLEQIADLLTKYDDEADIVDFLEQQKQRIEIKVRGYRAIVTCLDQIISTEREVRMTLKH